MCVWVCVYIYYTYLDYVFMYACCVFVYNIIPFVNFYALYLIFKTAVETLRTARQEEKIECAQKVERIAEKALSTLAAVHQKYVDAECTHSFMSQVKEDLTAHATEVCMSTLYAALTDDCNK